MYFPHLLCRVHSEGRWWGVNGWVYLTHLPSDFYFQFLLSLSSLTSLAALWVFISGWSSQGLAAFLRLRIGRRLFRCRFCISFHALHFCSLFHSSGTALCSGRKG